MKLKFSVIRDDTPICENVYAVSDAESFGAACSDLWERLTERTIANAKNVGALYDALEEGKAAELRGVRIQLEPLEP